MGHCRRNGVVSARLDTERPVNENKKFVVSIKARGCRACRAARARYGSCALAGARQPIWGPRKCRSRDGMFSKLTCVQTPSLCSRDRHGGGCWSPPPDGPHGGVAARRDSHNQGTSCQTRLVYQVQKWEHATQGRRDMRLTWWGAQTLATPPTLAGVPASHTPRPRTPSAALPRPPTQFTTARVLTMTPVAGERTGTRAAAP